MCARHLQGSVSERSRAPDIFSLCLNRMNRAASAPQEITELSGVSGACLSLINTQQLPFPSILPSRLCTSVSPSCTGEDKSLTTFVCFCRGVKAERKNEKLFYFYNARNHLFDALTRNHSDCVFKKVFLHISYTNTIQYLT